MILKLRAGIVSAVTVATDILQTGSLPQDAKRVIGVPKEVSARENRVALTPSVVEHLVSAGWQVIIETSAGVAAGFDDTAYKTMGAGIVSADAVWKQSDIVIKVQAPAKHSQLRHEADCLRQDQLVICLFAPAHNEALIAKVAPTGATVLSMDGIPRITRAQKMDVLSSMANIAGYRAVIEAANAFGSFFTGQITAAGKVPPAKVLVIGAGVAGLAAIAAARGLGAVVRAFDTRSAVKEQVQSLGGEFLEVCLEEAGEGQGGYAKVMSKEFIDAEMALFREQAKDIDIVITTALIPGRPAPKLWLKDMVKTMKSGSVVVDLAAQNGGNCECTVKDKVVVHDGVTIIGHTNMPSRLPGVASNLYATNVRHMLDEMGGAKDFAVDVDNEIVRGALVTHERTIMWPPPKVVEPTQAKTSASLVKDIPKKEEVAEVSVAKKKPEGFVSWVFALALAGLWMFLRFSSGHTAVSPAAQVFLQQLTVFVLACFVGWQVVWNVTAALHTPLMSVTNAISGIIIVGGIVQMTDGAQSAILWIGCGAIFFAAINIVGGFYVTQRMLKMFRR